MIEEKEIKKFLGPHVAVGVRNDFLSDKLFFYFGKIIEVDDHELKIKTSNGFKIIPLGQIKDIHIANGGQP